MREVSLFTGGCGGVYGSKILGWQTIAYVEWEQYCQQVIAQRIQDGIFDRAPIFTDVREFVQSGAARSYRGFADVVSAGWPCQDVSAAGSGDGIKGQKSGYWSWTRKCIRDIRPAVFWGENGSMLNVRGLDRVLCDLAQMGFDVKWGVIPASYVGADHKRERTWIVAYNASNRLEGWNDRNTKRQRCAEVRSMAGLRENKIFHDIPAPDAFGAANGVARRSDRLKAIGNGQVPICMAAAYEILSKQFVNGG